MATSPLGSVLSVPPEVYSPLSKFLVQDPTERSPPPKTTGNSKMATDNAAEDGGVALSRSEFLTSMEELKASIQLAIADQVKQAVQQAIQPLSDDLKAITTTLSKVAQAAETALETATTTQEEIQQLQRTEDWTRSKIMSMDNKLREKNLKFRNLPENVEQESDLKTFLASWISKALQLEDGVQPLIDKAYRLGPTQRKNEKFPRDVIAVFPDTGTKDRILAHSRTQPGFLYKETNEFDTPGLE
ncbi:UNVERIFIED_CONTAM: hypothetical protein K2H54_046112 [Gekko kuhli]